jgi:hypothetical protein
VVRQVTADGTVFDGFDDQGRPTSGVAGDGMTYDATGAAFQQFTDGGPAQPMPGGPVVQQIAADGTVVDGFDDQGRPTSGIRPDGSRFTTTYDAQGDTYQHFGDGTTVEYDPNGRPLRTWTAEGVEITWVVDLAALANATARVAVEQQVIANAARSLHAAVDSIQAVWSGPAGDTGGQTWRPTGSWRSGPMAHAAAIPARAGGPRCCATAVTRGRSTADRRGPPPTTAWS